MPQIFKKFLNNKSWRFFPIFLRIIMALHNIFEQLELMAEMLDLSEKASLELKKLNQHDEHSKKENEIKVCEDITNMIKSMESMDVNSNPAIADTIHALLKIRNLDLFPAYIEKISLINKLLNISISLDGDPLTKANAHYLVAEAYEQGIGTDKNMIKAIRFYRTALLFYLIASEHAEKNNEQLVIAQVNFKLGILTEKNLVPQSKEEDSKIKKPHPPEYYYHKSLNMYLQLLGSSIQEEPTSHDETSHLIQYIYSVEHEFSQCIYRLSQYCFSKNDYMTAYHILTLYIEKNLPESFSLLGDIFHYGLGQNIDYEKSKEYYIQAINRNKNYSYLPARLKLGELYEKMHDFKEAVNQYMFLTATDSKSYPEACYRLAKIFHFGLNGTCIPASAKFYYLQAYDHGISRALIDLAMLCENLGEYQTAKKYYEQATKKDVIQAEAFDRLGTIYQFGLDKNPPDLKKAEQCFKIAHHKQFADATFHIGYLLFTDATCSIEDPLL